MTSKKAYFTKIIDTSHPIEWQKALNSCGGHDVYHLPQYHRLSEQMGQGKAYLFLFGNYQHFAALPFLLTPTNMIGGLENSNFKDITSVYGYPGIVASITHSDKLSSEFKENFQNAFLSECMNLSAVSFFTRSNPLIDTCWLLADFFEVDELSNTVAINLNISDSEQLRNIRKGHRYDIRKAKETGLAVIEDKDFLYLDDFIEMYNETMERNSADERFYFSKKYYLDLKNNLRDHVNLVFARKSDKFVSSAIFLKCNSIIQYHLSGTSSEFVHLNGSKIIIDHMRSFGTRNGFRWLHLGGGVSSSDDKLFRFKSGFSKLRFPFKIIKHVINCDAFSQLCEMRSRWLSSQGHNLPQQGYFPPYRTPISSERYLFADE